MKNNNCNIDKNDKNKEYIEISKDVSVHLKPIKNKVKYIFKRNGNEFSNFEGEKPSSLTIRSNVGKEIIKYLEPADEFDKKILNLKFDSFKEKLQKLYLSIIDLENKRRKKEFNSKIGKKENINKDLFQNGKRKYFQDKNNNRIIRQKKVIIDKDSEFYNWVDEEAVLTIVPLRIDTYKNLETKEVYLRLDYLEKGEEKKKDFKDFEEIKSFIKRNGKNLGTSNYWAEYLTLVEEKGVKKEFYPEGITYSNGEYFYINENEEPFMEPNFDFNKIKKAKKQLKHHENISNIKDKKKFRSIILWALISKFFSSLQYDILRKENEIIPYLLLMGEPKTAKTTILGIIADIYNEKIKASQSIKSQFTLMSTLGDSKEPLIVDEAFSLFESNKKNMYIETLKANSTSGDEIGARGTKHQEKNHFLGKRTAAFTMNDQPEITDTGLIRRIIRLVFTKDDIVSERNELEYMELKRDGYVDNLKELIFYLQMKIINELNNTKNTFYDCVDKVLVDEGLEEYLDVIWVKDTNIITNQEEKLIEEEIYDLIHSELSKNFNMDKNTLIKEGYIQGLKEKDGKYYVTSGFIQWYNNKSNRFKISLSKLSRILDKNVKNIRFNRNQTSCVELDLKININD